MHLSLFAERRYNRCRRFPSAWKACGQNKEKAKKMVKEEEKSAKAAPKKAAKKATEKKVPSTAEPEALSIGFSTTGYPFRAIVVSDKMRNSVVVVRQFVRKITKYERYEKRTTRLTVHNPESIGAKTGDEVVVQNCRPISKTKSHTIISVVERSE